MRAVRQCFLAAAMAGLVFTLAAVAQTATTPQKKPAAKAPARSRTQRAHPKIAPGQECSACHNKEYQQWEAGPHGVNQVKCLVCHGAVEEGFVPKPAVSRCESCHAPLLAQLKSDTFMKGKTCFTCHPPHSLKPHASAASGGKP
ncbi:MAG: hypothetical protein ACE14M_05755 [Terriglobales bacterium]